MELRDGAKKLNTGLAGEAAPGAFALADGASKLKSGAGQLAAGAGDAKAGSSQLSAGSGQLATGAGKLNVGAGQLKAGLGKAAAGAPALMDGLDQVSAGLKLVDGGLVTMYGGIGQLPTLAQPIHAGIQQLLTGLGSKTTAGTLIYGVDAVRSGLASNALPGIDHVIGGLFNVPSGSNPLPGAYQKLGCAVVVLNDLVNGTAGRSGDPCYPGGVVSPLPGLKNSGNATVTAEAAGVTAVASGIAGDLPSIVADPSDPGWRTPNMTTLVGGLCTLRAGLDTHAPSGSDPGGAGYALSLVECGLSNATLSGCNPAVPGLLQGLALVDGGVSQLVSGVVSQVQGGIGQTADVAPAQNTLRGGVHAVMGGIDQISAGGLTLLDGLNQLNTGAGDLKTGTGQLVTGANKLAVGAGQLDTGLGQLSNGASLLNGGSVQLFDGANKLAAGLGDAATGSGQLADGLTTAVDSGKALPEGAAKLSAEGTSKLVEAGKSTASDYGLKYAVMVAGADRAKTEAMAYGAPADAAGATAYSLEISGANGDGGTDVGRGVGALALFGAGGGLVFFRRRFI
jgi:putative membrane protein